MEEYLILGYRVLKELRRMPGEDLQSYEARQQEYSGMLESAKRKYDKLLSIDNDIENNFEFFMSCSGDMEKVNALNKVLDTLLKCAE